MSVHRSYVSDFVLRRPCEKCGATTATVKLKRGQLIARCAQDHYCYAVPKADLEAQFPDAPTTLVESSDA